MHGLLAYIPLQCDQMKVWGHAEDSPRVNIINPRLWDVSLRIKTRVITPSHNSSVTMKEVLLRIDDSALDQFLGFIQLCPTVEVICTVDGVDTQDVIDKSFAYAITELRDRKVFKTPADYTYIMKAANDGVIHHTLFYYSPSEYIGYLEMLGLNNLIGRSTLYNNKDSISGKYPNWTFADSDRISQYEILRRKNIVVQFLSAFLKEKRRLLDAQLDK